MDENEDDAMNNDKVADVIDEGNLSALYSTYFDSSSLLTVAGWRTKRR